MYMRARMYGELSDSSQYGEYLSRQEYPSKHTTRNIIPSCSLLLCTAWDVYMDSQRAKIYDGRDKRIAAHDHFLLFVTAQLTHLYFYVSMLRSSVLRAVWTCCSAI